ncbi:hypothetical protein [Heyndrickxia camelliae]|uniref:Uncharacterized protein n=1 Tax=Heyndrickxia camelliae TaxID=1707093 RepID=A0A2N3LFW3_9BACI|nr:hypothetical protein [Heyndrickxia camelliae]PKR83520.1 hypothetical protein CWO92_18315 [Heyndrickxia camelliae]
MKLLRLKPEVYEYYRTKVKGNKDISYDQACKKLTRNVQCATELEPRNDFEKEIGNKAYLYGNLFIVVRKGRVVYLKNHSKLKSKHGWYFDAKKYITLSNELGIVS